MYQLFSYLMFRSTGVYTNSASQLDSWCLWCRINPLQNWLHQHPGSPHAHHSRLFDQEYHRFLLVRRVVCVRLWYSICSTKATEKNIMCQFYCIVSQIPCICSLFGLLMHIKTSWHSLFLIHFFYFDRYLIFIFLSFIHRMQVVKKFKYTFKFSARKLQYINKKSII